jgi:hypothetical protein
MPRTLQKFPAARKNYANMLGMPEPLYTRDEPPPFMGSWRNIYVAILIYLAVLIFIFHLFTRAYR